MVEKKRVVEHAKAEKARRTAISPEQRCTHRLAEGRQCGKRRWAGKEVCHLHDKARLGPQKLKEGGKQHPGFTPAQLQELLAMAMGQVLIGKMPVGQAYALGYLAQQSLAAHAAREKEMKLDVKHFWEMVDLGATFERAAELAKERKKEAKEAGPSASLGSSASLREAEEEEELTAEDAEDTEGTEEAREGEDEEGISESP